MNGIDITPIVEAVIALCAAAVTAFVVPWIKAKAGEAGLDNILSWVEIAVAAAEQLYSSSQGELKKEYVLNFISSKGYTIDEAALNNAIEAAVLELHNELYGSVKDEDITA